MTSASPAFKVQKPSTEVPPIGMPETVRVILDENEHIPPNGQYFGINGTGYLLKAGIEANVPKGIVDILDNAIETVPIVDPDTRRVVGWKQKRRYGYSRLS